MSLNPSDHAPWLRPPHEGFLTVEEKRWLDAIFSRILPEDRIRQIPGAITGAASNFVSILLAMDESVYFEIPRWRALYRAALPTLDAHARREFGPGLADLDDAAMNSLLAGLEAGSLPGLDEALDQKTLFTTLRRHTIQGCFADPRWGGNPDRVMWRALGYLQPPEDPFRG